VPGYLHNRRIGEVLDRLNIQPGAERIGENLRICYEALVEIEVFDPQELSLLDAWLNDLRALGLTQREQSTISAE
jgi:hypothetical protein